jgi:hypothetical protein
MLEQTPDLWKFCRDKRLAHTNTQQTLRRTSTRRPWDQMRYWVCVYTRIVAPKHLPSRPFHSGTQERHPRTGYSSILRPPSGPPSEHNCCEWAEMQRNSRLRRTTSTWSRAVRSVYLELHLLEGKYQGYQPQDKSCQVRDIFTHLGTLLFSSLASPYFQSMKQSGRRHCRIQ